MKFLDEWMTAHGAFARSALARAVRTMAQTAAAMLSTAVFVGDVNWGAVVSASALAGAYSVLTALATGLPEAPIADAPQDAEGGNAP